MKHLPSARILAAVAALSAVSALAEKTTNTFTRTSSQAASLEWSATGVANDYGTTAGLDVSLKIAYEDGAEKFQQLKTPTIPLYLDSVIGGKYHDLCFVYTAGSRYVTINDPTPFEGFWSISDGSARASGIYLPDNGGAGPRTIRSALVKGRFHIGVAQGCEAFFDYPFGLGMFTVNRSMNSISTAKGKLTVSNSPGPYSVVQVHYGTLGIVGGEDDTSSPVPDAWARFDASAEDSFSFDSKGVTEWRDADGRPVAASLESSNYNHPKRELDAVTGKTLVNFGNRGGIAAANAGARLKFAEAKDGIAEVFVVFRENSDTVAPSHLFGTVFPRSTSANNADQLFVARGSLPAELAMGEIRLNGQAVIPDVWYKRTRELAVVSAGYRSGGGSVLYIGGTEGTTSGGGAQIAEILFYTNTLTSAERRHNNDYLMKKWQGHGVRDYGVIMLDKPASLNVESGTARVRELNLATNGFVKAGAGTLEIESVNTNLNGLAVNGGSVRFANTLARPENPQPPADALAWFDASDTDTLDTVVSNYNGTTYTFVSNWRDKRANGYTLHSPRLGTKPSYAVYEGGGSTDEPAWPTLDESTGAHPMVDLGPWVNPSSSTYKGHFGWINGISGLSSWLCLFTSSGGMYSSYGIREGFVVFYKTDARGNPINSTDWALRNAGGDAPKTKFLENNYAGGAALSGHWTYDGVTVNPSDVRGGLPANGKAHLGAFLISDAGVPANVFGSDQSGGNSAGGCKIAEVILYTRYLTEQERLDTERYLMAKWDCGTHPGSVAPSVGTLTFNNGTPAVIDTDVDMTIGTVQCGTSGALAKKGTGTATVTQLTASAPVSSLAFEGGSLNVMSDITIADGTVIDAYFDEEGNLAGKAAISGPLTIGDTASVRVHIPDGVAPDFGKYDFITASQVNGSVSSWTTTVIGGDLRGTVSVGCDPTTGIIHLNVNPNGMLIIFK